MHLNVVEMRELQDVGIYAKPSKACKAIVGKNTSGIQGRREVEASGTESSKTPIKCGQKGCVCRYCLSTDSGREVARSQCQKAGAEEQGWQGRVMPCFRNGRRRG